MKKTFQLFEEESVDYEFIDYKKQKPDASLIKGFINKLGLDTVLNKKGMTYRKLGAGEKKATEQLDTATQVLLDKTSMIKRPIIAFSDGELMAGFDEEKLRTRLK